MRIILLCTLFLFSCVDKYAVPDTPIITGMTAEIIETCYAYHKKNVYIDKQEFIERDSNGDLAVFSSGDMELFKAGEKITVERVVLDHAKVRKDNSCRAYWINKKSFELR